jgi:hypothetical protein
VNAWARRAADAQLPLWIRVVAYAEANAHPDGHCPLTPEQLHHGLDPTLSKGAVSRAIARAVAYGWLNPTSSARCLVLDRATPTTRCPATHKTPTPLADGGPPAPTPTPRRRTAQPSRTR